MGKKEVSQAVQDKYEEKFDNLEEKVVMGMAKTMVAVTAGLPVALIAGLATGNGKVALATEIIAIGGAIKVMHDAETGRGLFRKMMMDAQKAVQLKR